MKIHPFFKTIRFKLTFFYSLTLFLFSSLFVFGLNIYINTQFSNQFRILPPARVEEIRVPKELINLLSPDEITRFIEVRRNDLTIFQNATTLALIPLAIISFLGGYYISGKLLGPLHKINAKVKKINAEYLNRPLEGNYADDELGELVKNFNAMLKKLHSSFDQQTKFISDASHEIKTPLAIIQTNLDTILSDETATKAELIKAMRQALIGVESLNNLTEHLLTLSLPHLENEPFDVFLVAEQQVNSLMQFAKEKNVDLHITKVDLEQKEKGSPILFGRAIFNIIENAIKYSPGKENASVTIQLQSDAISIKDTGPGIPEKDLPFIFNRFYRVGKSRSRKNGSFGLGLAISKKIFEDHGWNVQAENREKGVVFKIRKLN